MLEGDVISLSVLEGVGRRASGGAREREREVVEGVGEGEGEGVGEGG